MTIRILDVIAKKNPYSDIFQYFVVVDRMPSLIYSRDGNRLTSSDDGVHDFLQIERGTTQAFAGREFDITMDDGSVYHAKGDVWSVAAPKDFIPTVNVGISTLSKLADCYVFSSACLSLQKLEDWLATNTASTNYCKYDVRSTLAYLEPLYRKGARTVCAARARTLRKRGVTIWRDDDGVRSWSPSFEWRKARLADEAANDPGSVRIGASA